MAGLVIFAVLTALYLIFVCCQWKNIQIGAAIMDAAGHFLATNPHIALVPLIIYALILPVVAWYAAVNVFLYSCGTPYHEERSMFAKLQETQETYAMFWIFMFGFFWIVAFLIAIQQFTVAASAAIWYFTAGAESDANNDHEGGGVFKALGWAFRYHLGSLAFGALLIAIVTMLRVVFEYFAKKAEKLSGDNVIVKAVLCYVRCMLWCLDKCVKFITENAYVQVAISGCSFCDGAYNSFWMIIRNAGTYSAMSVVGWIMTTIGKGVICGASVWLTMVLAKENVLVTYENGQIQQPFVPAFLVLLVAWLVSSLFISIFDFSCLTILQCFLTCRESSSSGKIFAPPALKEYLGQFKEDGEEFDDKPQKGDFDKIEKKGSGNDGKPNNMND